MNQDQEHLRLLSIFHYVVAGLGALIACIPLIHLTVGVLMVTGRLADGRNPPPPALGWILVGLGAAAVVAGWTFAALIARAGRCLARRTHYTYCLVMAALLCVLCSPFGAVLGVFTIIVLLRPSVKALFGVPVAVA
jgi:hypothetical protein